MNDGITIEDFVECMDALEMACTIAESFVMFEDLER